MSATGFDSSITERSGEYHRFGIACIINQPPLPYVFQLVARAGAFLTGGCKPQGLTGSAV